MGAVSARICGIEFFPVPPDVLLIALANIHSCQSIQICIDMFSGITSGRCCRIYDRVPVYGSGRISYSRLLWFRGAIPGCGQPVQKIQRVGRWDSRFLHLFPYKVFTISAGAFKINFVIFLIASAISRSARFFLVGWLIYKFGPGIRLFIDRYFNVLAFVFVALLIGGFILVKYLL